MTKKMVSFRAPTDWLKQIDIWSKKYNISRSGSIVLLTKIAMESLSKSKIDVKYIEKIKMIEKIINN